MVWARGWVTDMAGVNYKGCNCNYNYNYLVESITITITLVWSQLQLRLLFINYSYTAITLVQEYQEFQTNWNLKINIYLLQMNFKFI